MDPTDPRKIELVSGAVSGVGHPSAYLKGLLGRLPPGTTKISIEQIADEAVMVEAFAKVLQEKLIANQRPDGGVDLKKVAADVLKFLRDNQREIIT